ncbi:hypothetical protein M1D93_14805 [Arthrobacter sp. Z1-9]
MAISEFAFALCALLGTLLVPFFVLYQMLRLKRRAVRVTTPAAPRGDRR